MNQHLLDVESQVAPGIVVETSSTMATKPDAHVRGFRVP
jgi:hypothetical protein